MANEFKKVLTPIALILVLFLGVSAYFYKNYGSKISSKESVNLKLGEIVPDFSVERLPGRERLDLYQSKSKVTWIHFWATWCQSCVVEMPAIERVFKKYQGADLDLIAVTLDEDPFVDVPPMIKKLKTTFPIYWSPDQSISEVFDISFIPFSVFIDSNHKILWVEIGDGDWDSNEMHEMIDSWLKK
ncbi:MAG: TlpA family protein disulfide reductase [Xanthomonadaceae bacterium]|nr:TlpA family protein disulfide reductase [Xanthomonadaceae bacterium]